MAILRFGKNRKTFVRTEHVIGTSVLHHHERNADGSLSKAETPGVYNVAVMLQGGHQRLVAFDLPLGPANRLALDITMMLADKRYLTDQIVDVSSLGVEAEREERAQHAPPA